MGGGGGEGLGRVPSSSDLFSQMGNLLSDHLKGPGFEDQVVPQVPFFLYGLIKVFSS